MADPVKSALFVDYDSIYRRLNDTSGNAAGQLAERIGACITAIETGRLVSPKVAGTRRRILIRRCYADPDLLGRGRAPFTASGFEVVDCPLQEGRARNSADIHIVLDTVDALEHPTGYDEFILLSADTDLTPLLLRLRAHNRTTVIYANDGTAASYKAFADGMIEEEPLIALLDGSEDEAEASVAPSARTTDRAAQAAAAAGPPADRGTLEAVARKIHAATNVPMFSPRTYADLFRAIAQEIAERGYHFQDTADNVTARLTTAGRNVNRRQVLFVVKGLALKGHVFSTTDSPDTLAEVFREQVFYLIGNTDLVLDESEQALLRSWIVGRVGASTPVVPELAPERAEADTNARSQRRRAAKPPPPPAKQAPPPREPAKPPQREPQPAQAREAPRKEPPRETVSISAPAAAVAPPAPQPARPVLPRRLDEIRAAAAARLAAIGRPSPGPTPPAKALARPAPAAKAPPPKPAAPRSAPPRQESGGQNRKDPLESSILAAIAEAVDVLVEDGGSNESDQRRNEDQNPAPPQSQPQPAAAAERPAEPQPSEGGDSDDIGDEIQRIIASYSRARQGEGQ